MSFFRVATMASLLMLCAGNAFGVEKVGSTVSAQDTIEGQGAVGDRQIATADPIYRDEKLRANETGLGQFELGDGTKLVLGRNAQITVDKFVTGGGGSPASITLNAVAGSFRFITGHSDHNAYRIFTPQGTIGVRGTAFEGSIYNGTDQSAAENGQVWFCNRDAAPGAMPLRIEPTADMPGAMPSPTPAIPIAVGSTILATFSSPMPTARLLSRALQPTSIRPRNLKTSFRSPTRKTQLRPQFRLDSAACLGTTAGGGGVVVAGGRRWGASAVVH